MTAPDPRNDDKNKNLRRRNLVTLLLIAAFAVFIYLINMVKLSAL